MKTAPVKVTDDIYWLGVHDPKMDAFETVLATPGGTTYNAYLIKAEKATLVETVRVTFRDEYLAKLKSLIDPLEIQYLILNHTESDHAGAVPWVLEAAPNAQIITSEAACRHVCSLFNLSGEMRAVNDGDTLDLGDRTLSFIAAPYLHWPDTMFTYSPRDRVIFTCDAFGSHYCDVDAVFDDEAGDFAEAYRFYFDHIMRPFKDKVRAAVAKLDGLAIDVICNGHGPVLRKDPRRYIELYRRWSEEADTAIGKPVVAVFYLGGVGNTAQIADQVARGLTSRDVIPVLCDLTAAGAAAVGKLLAEAAGVLVGVPTAGGEALAPVEGVLEMMSAATMAKKPAAAFGSFGGTGGTVRDVAGRLEALGACIVEPSPGVDFAPDEDVFQAWREFGQVFAAAVTG